MMCVPVLVRKAAIAASALSLFLTGSAHAQTAETVYNDAMKNGWDLYSSWAGWDPNNTAPSRSGKSIKATPGAGSYGAVTFRHQNKPYRSDLFTSVSFWVYTDSPGQLLKVCGLRTGQAAQFGNFNLTAPTPGQWTQYTLTLAQLGIGNVDDFEGFWIQDQTGQARTFYIDDVQLNMTGAPASTAVSVNTGTTLRPFSERLLGTNLVDFMEYNNPPTFTPQRNLLSQTALRFLRWPGGNIANQTNWSTNKRISKDGTQEEFVNANFSQFLQFLFDPAINGKAIISVNYGQGSPEMAAAWVAYCNGSPSSTQVIGTGKDWSRTANGWVDVNWQTVGYWASLRAATPLGTDDGRNFLRIGRAAPIGVTHWEVGNENYGDWQTDLTDRLGQGYTARNGTSYGQRSRMFIQKMKAVDSSIKVGVVVDPLGEGAPAGGVGNDPNWDMNAFAALAVSPAVVPDFVIPHVYNQQPGKESDVYLLQSSKREWKATTDTLRAKLNTAFGTSGAANIKMIATEHNLVSSDPGKQATSIVNALFAADSLGQAMQTELDGINQWAFHGSHDFNQPATWNNNDGLLYGWNPIGDYSLFDGRSSNLNAARTDYLTKYAPFYAWKLLKNFAAGGDTVVAATTGSPYVSAYSVKKPDGKLHVLLLNKHRDSAITGNLALTGFTPQASATLYQFGKTQDTNASLGQTGSAIDVQTVAVSNAAANFPVALPAYSISLLTMTPGSGGGTPGGANNGTGLRGSYFNNRTLTGAATGTRTDATVGFDWGDGAPGVTGVGVDNFSVRWEGQVEAPVSGSYTFTTNSDDGVRLWVNGSQIINNWTDHGPVDDSGSVTLTAGQKYDIKMEFYENGGGAVAKLDWLYPGQARQRVPQTRLYPATTTTGGDPAVYNFEATTHSFATGDQGISGIASSADRASAGANALRVSLNTGTTGGYGTLYKATPGPSLTGGKTVTSRVWFPSGSNLNAIQLFVHQANGTWTGNHVGTGTLTPNAWNTITVTVPNTGSAVNTLGVQFHYNAGPWSGACYVDSINW